MAYTSSDPATRLAAVRAAIDACLEAQEYEVGGTGTNRGKRRQLKARLAELMELEERLMYQVQESSAPASVAAMPPVT